MRDSKDAFNSSVNFEGKEKRFLYPEEHPEELFDAGVDIKNGRILIVSLICTLEQTRSGTRFNCRDAEMKKIFELQTNGSSKPAPRRVVIVLMEDIYIPTTVAARIIFPRVKLNTKGKFIELIPLLEPIEHR